MISAFKNLDLFMATTENNIRPEGCPILFNRVIRLCTQCLNQKNCEAETNNVEAEIVSETVSLYQNLGQETGKQIGGR